jgi:hypothetical protein
MRSKIGVVLASALLAGLVATADASAAAVTETKKGSEFASKRARGDCYAYSEGPPYVTFGCLGRQGAATVVWRFRVPAGARGIQGWYYAIRVFGSRSNLHSSLRRPTRRLVVVTMRVSGGRLGLDLSRVRITYRV